MYLNNVFRKELNDADFLSSD